jgi:TonB family protein
LGWDERYPLPETPEQCVVPIRPGQLEPELIQKVVRANFGTFRSCYEEGLARNANLEGRVAVRFVVNQGGWVTSASVSENTLADCEVVECIRAGYMGLEFPEPTGGQVTVVYPISFSPG